MTTIASRVAEMEQGLAAQAPAEVLSAFGSERAALRAAGTPDVTAVGSKITDGDLLDAHGKPTTLADVRAGKPAVVVFYRGVWCPYCNITLRSYQEELVGELEKRGATLIALSPQEPDGSLTMQETNKLTFAVVSDPGSQIARELGILTTPTDDVREAQGALGLDLAKANADGTYDIPMPTTVIIDADGVIRWIDVHADYSTRSESADILAAYDKP